MGDLYPSGNESGDDRSLTPEPEPLSQLSRSPPYWSHHLTPDMATIISDAIERGIAAGLQYKSSSHSTPSRASSGSRQHRSRENSASSSHEVAGSPSQPSVFGEEECPVSDSDLLEDEGLPPDPPTFVGLFKPAVFRSLLF